MRHLTIELLLRIKCRNVRVIFYGTPCTLSSHCSTKYTTADLVSHYKMMAMKVVDMKNIPELIVSRYGAVVWAYSSISE